MTDQKNAIIVGAGHNGLTCGAYLAKAGYEVLILEGQDHVGGAADTREFAEGFQSSGCAHFVYQLPTDIVRELSLTQHGLAFAATGLSTLALSEHGEPVVIDSDSLSGSVGDRDREGQKEFNRLMRRFGVLLARYFGKTPPLLVNNTSQDLATMARFGLDIRRLGRDDMREFLRIIAINIYDVLNEFFDNDLVKGAISLDAVLGTHLGPRSPNSVLSYLHRLSGNTTPIPGAMLQPLGGMGNVTGALEKAAISAGAKIRTDARVAEIIVEHGKTTGVRLVDGEVIRSMTVVSNADPKTTILSLVGARHCETGFVRRISNLRAYGNTAKLHLGLTGIPRFNGVDETNLKQRLLIAPDMDHVERAFNPAKYGEFSENPVMEISVPTMNDPSLAPAGQHVLSAIVQYAPYRLKGGWTQEAKQGFYDRVMDTLSRYAPNIREQIVARELLTPVDIEARYGIYGGHWHHAELTLDQFLMVRPVPGAAQYAMPVDGLYLCGAGSHPGGGVAGMAGRNAARVIVKSGSKT